MSTRVEGVKKGQKSVNVVCERPLKLLKILCNVSYDCASFILSTMFWNLCRIYKIFGHWWLQDACKSHKGDWSVHKDYVTLHTFSIFPSNMQPKFIFNVWFVQNEKMVSWTYFSCSIKCLNRVFLWTRYTKNYGSLPSYLNLQLWQNWRFSLFRSSLETLENSYTFQISSLSCKLNYLIGYIQKLCVIF